MKKNWMQDVISKFQELYFCFSDFIRFHKLTFLMSKNSILHLKKPFLCQTLATSTTSWGQTIYLSGLR